MKDLGEFFDKNWVMGRPKIFIANRETLDSVSDRISNRWVLGYTGRMGVYLLEQGKFTSDSEQKREFNNDEYETLMKHELAHLFFELVAQTPGYRKPSWLSEGVSIYTSEEYKKKKKPIEFKNFLNFFENGQLGVYVESGWVVKLLVDNYGKEKLLELIKSLKEKPDQQKFLINFERIYGFEINYDKMNELMKESA